MGNLVLRRKAEQRVFLDRKDGSRIIVTVIEVCGQFVRLGFNAPVDVTILREELVKTDDDSRTESSESHDVAIRVQKRSPCA